MKYKIQIDPLDVRSIEDGLYLLKAYQEIERKAIYKTFPERLLEDACKTAKIAYGSEPVTVSYRLNHVGDNSVSYSIFADGDQVCFVEFGTGIFANPEQAFAPEAQKNLGIRVAPGSWSMSPEGKKTFLETDAADQYGYEKGPVPLGDWEYTRPAAGGLFAAYMDIVHYFERTAREVFSNRVY